MIAKRSVLFLIILYLAFTYKCQAQGIVEKNKIIYSQILKQEVYYSVLLPERYAEQDTRYSAVYLLHGLGGDQNSWLQRCMINSLTDSLMHQASIDQLIYIMPAAYDSYYINNFDSSFRYMDFFVKELVPAIDSLYRTLPERKHRALLGMSMGGFGAIILGMKHPELFGSAVCLSAAVRNEPIFIDLPQEKYDSYFGRVYGHGRQANDRITEHWMQNSPFYILDSTLISKVQTIHWYIDCGFDDFLLPANEAFHRLLIQNNISHEYHVRPGEHNWNYWYRSTVNGLIYLNQVFNE
jgi:enterochelin esterase-like enzyme